MIMKKLIAFLMAAAMLLRQTGISFRKAYNLRENGAPEELRL